MEFKLMGAEEYRALDADQLAARRDAVVGILEGSADMPDGITVRQLSDEAKVIAGEFARRNEAVELRNLQMKRVIAGEGKRIEERGAAASEPASDPFDTAEYRDAFMDYVVHGTEIPMELRSNSAVTVNGAFAQTSDVSPQVPTTMAREIVQKMDEYGTIWNKVRKLSVQGGLWFRVVDINLEATWVGEAETSPIQKVSNSDKVSFSFYQLECRMAQTLLASAVTFADFQAMFVPAVAKAMVKALEQAIVRGKGTNGPLGIVNEPRITTVVEMTAADIADWTKWHTQVKSKIPRMYRKEGEFLFAQGTWDSYIETLRDKDDRPVSQTGYNPVTGEEEMRLMGLPTETVDETILPDFDSAGTGDVIGIFGNLANYAVNTQPGMPLTTKRWIDDDNNLDKIKALMAVDGKVLDPYGFVLIKKKASA